MKTILNVALLLTVTLSMQRCTEPTVIGGDLLEGAELPVAYTDSLPIAFSVVSSKPATADARSASRQRVLPLGCFVDPIYGEVSSKIGASFLEFDGARNVVGNTIDSVFLTLPLDPNQQVGDTTATVSIRVTAAAPNTLGDLRGLTTEDDFEGTGRVYAEASFVPERDSVLVNNFNNGALTVERTGAQVRIPLNAAFEDDLIAALQVQADQDTLSTDSIFLENLPGVVIEATACGETAAALQVSGGVSQPTQFSAGVLQPNYFGIQIYYRDAENRTQTRRLRPFRTARDTRARIRLASTRNLEGTYVNELLNGGGDADTLAVVGAFGGAITRVDLTDVSSLSSNVVVSFASLQLPIVDRGGEGPVLLVEGVRNSGDTVLTRVSPLGRGNTSPAQAAQNLSFDGGFVRLVPNTAGGGVDSVRGYQLNVTDFMQRVANGEVEPVLYVQPISEAGQMPASSLLLGPKSTSGAQARLIVATTRLP